MTKNDTISAQLENSLEQLSTSIAKSGMILKLHQNFWFSVPGPFDDMIAVVER